MGRKYDTSKNAAEETVCRAFYRHRRLRYLCRQPGRGRSPRGTGEGGRACKIGGNRLSEVRLSIECVVNFKSFRIWSVNTLSIRTSTVINALNSQWSALVTKGNHHRSTLPKPITTAPFDDTYTGHKLLLFYVRLSVLGYCFAKCIVKEVYTANIIK